MPLLDDKTIASFHEDGAVILRGALSVEWIETLRQGVKQNMGTPGPYTRGYTKDGEPGHFFGDYCNWRRIEAYRSFFFDSPAADLAGALMGSSKVNLFHEHVLVKEPGTLDRTPWHHDQPYYCVDGHDTCSLWIPLDPVSRDVCVEFVAGSHRWGRWFTPTKFVGVRYDRQDDGYEVMPDIDANLDDYRFLSWDLEPGDCIAFHFLTVHGAPGNLSQSTRRRAFAARFTGADVTYVRRQGEMSPPFPEVNLKPGQKLDCDTFPVLRSG
jgi:ectoine hydroxylase-related dioxygenase (phytanoyl-CoA dioxygenase family)